MAGEEAGRAGPRHKLHGRRKGHRLRGRQAALLETLLPTVRLPADQDIASADDVRALFQPRPERIWMEIGFGGGEHLLHQARGHRDTGFIGCEPFVNGVAKLLAGIDEEGLANIRIHDGDARELLPRLPQGCLERVYLLYPDPWPKKRHRKRRFVSPQNLAELARVIRGGGELIFASDIDDYVDWTLRHIAACPSFEWTARCADDWRQPPPGWPGTRYEEKAMAAGRVPAYLRFRRVARQQQ
jgi:tRNA (guanine-N7-)-methyltransferase